MVKLFLKGQSSLEYMFIVALTLTIIIPATYLFYSYSRDSGQDITDAQLTKLGRNIVDSAETIFYSGIGSKTTVDVTVPSGVLSTVIIDGRELVFNVSTNIGVSEIVFFSSVNITTDSSKCNANICQIPGLSETGVKKLKIESISKDSVSINTI